MDVVEELRAGVKWTQSFGEEVANSVSHGVGLIAAAIGAPVLLWAAWIRENVAFSVGVGIFAATTVLLYLGSTLYHAWPQTRFKHALQVIDHSAIFLLIAGTYTPFALGPLRGPWGWSILAVIWGLALCGVFLKTKRGVLHRPKLALCLYLAMGWLAVFMFPPLSMVAPLSTILWLAGGGIAYTVGIIFFLREHVRYNHFVWHVFVLGGTLCHYVAVLTYATSGA